MLTPEQCAYRVGYWRYWYEADHRFGLGTIYFFVIIIAIFALSHLFRLSKRIPSSKVPKSSFLQTTTRWLSYKGSRLEKINYNTPPAGVAALGVLGFIFFTVMTLGPQPYYWPNTRTTSFGSSPPIATRAGWMALGCMPFVLATASKANLVTFLTGISHEKLQIFHRWISHAMFVLALIHTFPFIVYRAGRGELAAQWSTVYYWTGVAALIPQAWLTFASIGPLRRAGYESFKILHFLAAILFIVFFFIHCNFRLSSWDYFIATAAIYIPSLLYSLLRTYFQHGLLPATLTTTPNGFIHVSIPIKAHWRPGQHFFVRLASFGLHGFTAHPFTACSLPEPVWKESKLVFYIRAQKGFTGRLFNYVSANQGCSMKVLLDGPYGGIEPSELARGGRHVVIAGGSGAGWTLPLIERAVQYGIAEQMKVNGADEAAGRTPRSLRVVLATREAATYEWFTSRVEEIYARYSGYPNSTGANSIEIFFTGDETAVADSDEEKGGEGAAESLDGSGSSPGAASVGKGQAHTGRPDLPALIQAEAEEYAQEGLSVFACGPLSMQHDIREACAKAQFTRAGRQGGVTLHLEHFDWA
ncbi:ferric reductase like transmembrane component-domain-containing protein [Elsinoe ampelina]|uniref:ferric-chelate reductase (NADPH) n=1 Tax=Elsinoe ampelina TaxID=302913 RepID=A0A6A6G6G9_9PEZI|nr:ferric reductase like transmembrane component-domain-containing protein [Elsinoe ampelina]